MRYIHLHLRIHVGPVPKGAWCNWKAFGPERRCHSASPLTPHSAVFNYLFCAYIHTHERAFCSGAAPAKVSGLEINEVPLSQKCSSTAVCCLTQAQPVGLISTVLSQLGSLRLAAANYAAVLPGSSVCDARFHR